MSIRVSSIELSKNIINLKVGEKSSELYATVYPTNASNKKVIWCCCNPSVAKVYSNGTIEALSEGYAEIIASTEDGSYTAVCRLYVKPLLIYQTRDTETVWFGEEGTDTTESIRPDLYFNDLSKEDIKKEISSIKEEMFVKNNSTIKTSEQKASFDFMANTIFANETFRPIITDMINHFMREKIENFNGTINSYDKYYNSNLTTQVKNSSQSKEYIDLNINVLKDCLCEFNGNILALEYHP